VVDGDVTLAEGAEGATAPNLLDRRGFRHYFLERRDPRILEMDMIDPAGPGTKRRHRIAAPEEQVAGVEAKPNVTDLEQPLDLPLGLNIGGGMVVKGGF